MLLNVVVKVSIRDSSTRVQKVYGSPKVEPNASQSDQFSSNLSSAFSNSNEGGFVFVPLVDPDTEDPSVAITTSFLPTVRIVSASSLIHLKDDILW